MYSVQYTLTIVHCMSGTPKDCRLSFRNAATGREEPREVPATLLWPFRILRNIVKLISSPQKVPLQRPAACLPVCERFYGRAMLRAQTSGAAHLFKQSDAKYSQHFGELFKIPPTLLGIRQNSANLSRNHAKYCKLFF